MNYAANDPIRVVLVAPSMTCWGLERLVQSASPRFELVGTATGFASAQQAMAGGAVDVIVVDLEGSADPGLFDAVHERVMARVIVLTSTQDVSVLDRAVLGGVRGVVRKSEPPDVLLKAIEKVHDGELWIDRGATSRLFMEMARQKAAANTDPERMKIATLTLREREMIAAVAADTSAPGKVIAQRLCISEHTLRNHLSSIYGKLGLSSRVDLYAYATRHSLHKQV
jgi:two-component system nitrate/nitrite response regulator NarL